MKKIIAFILVFVFLFGCGVTAFAADEPETMYYNGVELPVFTPFSSNKYYLMLASGRIDHPESLRINHF